MRLRVAARTSRLSLEQVRIALDYISRRLGGVSYEIIGVKTLGDIARDKPLHQLGRKGVFEKEVNKALLDGRADIAVHSMKDLPSRLENGLEIVLVPPRGPREDSLVPRRGLPALPPERLPEGALVAAGSLRRRYSLHHANPSLRFTWIRGNLDTRLRRLDEGRADYLVAAEAGLSRLGVERPRHVLDPRRFVPAPGQGLIAVVALAETSIARTLRGITHPSATREALAERAFLERLSAGCSAPVGGTAWAGNGGTVTFVAADYSPERGRPLIVRVESRDPWEAGERAAVLLAGGG